MKILLLASFAPSLINFRGPLIKDLADMGHDVLVVAPDMDTTLVEKLRQLGATPHQLPLSRTSLDPFGDLLYCWRLYRLIKHSRTDLLLSYTIKPNIWGAFAAAKAKVPSVALVTGLGYAFTETGRTSIKQRVVRGIAKRLYRSATNRNRRVIFQNPDDLDDFAAAGCLADQRKAGIIHGSGVDTEYFTPAPLPDAPVFLMIARLLKNKGVREYAEAAKLVLNDRPQAQFFLVGPFDEGPDGIDPDELKHWEDSGLNYLGPLEDVRPALSAARVYVLPSYREGTPRSVLEAMAMGRAVITSDAPGCRETVQNEENGYLVPIQEIEILADRMRRMIDDPIQTAEMGKISLRIVKEKYDVRKVNRQLLIYLGLVENPISDDASCRPLSES